MIAMLRRYFIKPIFTRKEKWWFAAGILTVLGAFFVDDAVLKNVGLLRFYPMDALMLFITDFGMLFFVILTIFYLLARKKFRDIVLVGLTAACTLEISYLLKVIFQTPRPYVAEIVATIPLTQASSFSMPSLHTAFCFSFWPFLSRFFPQRKLRIFAKFIIITVSFSRLYLGVHYASDIIFGGLIGYVLARFWIYLEEEHKILESFVYQVKDKLELRRQVAHLLTGIAIVFLLKIQLLNEQMLFVILILGGLLSIIVRYYRIPVIDRILLFFERPEDLKSFPGKGSFFFVLGSLLALQFFSFETALAAISIMAVGDAITTVIGTYFGKIKNPLNPKKHLEGTAIAIIASTFAAFFFVPFHVAFLGSLAGMIFESITVRYISQIIDDNVVIPVVAGLTMVLVG